MKDIRKWLGYAFEQTEGTGEDYKTFQKEARADLKKKASSAGFSIAEFNKNHYEFSAVLEKDGSGDLVYMSIPDVRFWPDKWYTDVMYRKMADSRDYSGKGGYNHYTAWEDIPEALNELMERCSAFAGQKI